METRKEIGVRCCDIVSERELERPDRVGLRLGMWVCFSVMGSYWSFLGSAHDML